MYRDTYIRFEWIEGIYSGKRLTAILAKIIRTHGLNNRIYAIITDNAGNIGTLFKEVIKVYKRKDKRVKIIVDLLPPTTKEYSDILVVLDSEYILYLAYII